MIKKINDLMYRIQGSSKSEIKVLHLGRRIIVIEGLIRIIRSRRGVMQYS